MIAATGKINKKRTSKSSMPSNLHHKKEREQGFERQQEITASML